MIGGKLDLAPGVVFSMGMMVGAVSTVGIVQISTFL